MNQDIVTCQIMGGLGNQMFQIFTALAYSIKHNRRAVFQESVVAGSRTKTYWDTIFRRLTHVKEHEAVRWILHKEKSLEYKKIPDAPEGFSLCLNGYFQSFKYFEEYTSLIKMLIAPLDSDLWYIKNKYFSIDNKLGRRVCSIHVRRGDYLNLSDIYTRQTEEYYAKAMEFVETNSIPRSGEESVDFVKTKSPDKIDFFVFSDDLEWCRKQPMFDSSKGSKFTFIDEDDYISLYIMFLCDHHIIANSSFSWMGAMFADNSNGITIAPSKWYEANGPKHNLDDMIPPTWIRI